MELRGKVRRGYFVSGLAGSQFALPEAVERLRGAAEDEPEPPFIVMAASDPANPYTLELAGREPDAISRPRGSGALLVTRSGTPVMSAEARGRRVSIPDSLSDADTIAATRALVEHLHASDVIARRRRDIVIELVNGVPAARSARADVIRAAGFRLSSEDLRWYAPI
jgi:ATP-dependent Lhr-like helicase